MNRYFFKVTLLDNVELFIETFRDTLQEAWLKVIADYGNELRNVTILETDNIRYGNLDMEI